MTSERAALLLAEAAGDKKAFDPVVLDLRTLTSITDYFVVVSGTSDRHVQAVAANVLDAAKAAGLRPLGLEGLNAGRWALLDFGDVVVHVFHRPLREHYDLERFWIDAPRLPLKRTTGKAG